MKPGPFEESIEFIGIWLVLVAVLGHFSDVVPTPSARVRRALYALPALWIILLVLSIAVPRLDLWLFAQPASVDFETDFSLYGYRTELDGEAYQVQLFASANPHYFPFFGFSIHLVDQANGDSVASRNVYGQWLQEHLLAHPGYQPVSRQWIQVDIPPGAPRNRALWAVLSLWREQENEYVVQKILSSDHQLLSDEHVILGEFVLAAASESSLASPLATFDNGFKLDPIELPERAPTAAKLTLSFGWQSDKNGSEDYVQFLHFVHEESGDMWGFDQQPLGPRLPTRLWYRGLADVEDWEVPLPADIEPGQYEVFTGLYRISDLERLTATDAAGTNLRDARVPLGILIVERS